MPGRWILVGVVAMLSLMGIGCSKQVEVAPGPAEAVHEFLQAVQSGDDQKSAGMLTSMAREKTAELDLEVAPPGSKTASFTVGEVEMVDENGAYVGSTWSDIDPEGVRHDDQIVWVLRREPEGWRIAGMVTKLFEGKLVLNFEDPEDMLRKQELAAEEMERRAKAEQSQAEQQQQPAQIASPGKPTSLK